MRKISWHTYSCFTAAGLLLILSGTAYSYFQNKPSNEVVAKVRSLGKEAAMTLMSSLKQSLGQAMAEGGPAQAVQFCSQEAIPLTEQAEASMKGLSIKRTSHRYRNPDNAPDKLEEKALEHLLETGASDFIQRVGEGDEGYFRYYQPLKTGSFCLTCHGSEKSFSEELRRVLQKRYPDDRATGYEEGDFRGVIRVEIPGDRLND